MRPAADKIDRRVAEVRGVLRSAMLVTLYDDRAAAIKLLESVQRYCPVAVQDEIRAFVAGVQS